MDKEHMARAALLGAIAVMMGVALVIALTGFGMKITRKVEIGSHQSQQPTSADVSGIGTHSGKNMEESSGYDTTDTVETENVNYVRNAGFEDPDTSMWNVYYAGSWNPTDIQDYSEDAYSGDKAFHFYNEFESQVFMVEQIISDLPAGTYAASAKLQGGDVGEDAKFYLYVIVGDHSYMSEEVVLDGWANWKTPQIDGIEVDGNTNVVIGISARCAAKGWGTFDDIELSRINSQPPARADFLTAETDITENTDENGTHDVVGTAGMENVNYVRNAGFEDPDTSMWKVYYEGRWNPTDIQDYSEDAYSGDKAFHFYDGFERPVFQVEQTISDLPTGTYAASAKLQGGDVGENAEFYLYVIVGSKVYRSETVELDGWVNWKTPEIDGIEVDGNTDVVIGISAECAAKGWGTFDDFKFYSIK